MTTTIRINSLARYNVQNGLNQNEKNPFCFTVSSKITSKWRWKRNLQNQQLREKETYEIKLCSMVIPASLVECPLDEIMVEVTTPSCEDSGSYTNIQISNIFTQRSSIDDSILIPTEERQFVVCGDDGCYEKPIVTHTFSENVRVNTNASPKSNMNNTFIAKYDRTTKDELGNDKSHIYVSCCGSSIRSEPWSENTIGFKLLDACTGNPMTPINVDFSDVSSYNVLFFPENQVRMNFTAHYLQPSLIRKIC